MKKKVLITMLVALFMVFAVVFSACNLFDFVQDLQPQKMSAPKITIIGNTVVWDSVEKAGSYDVYKDGELVSNTTDLYYIDANNNKNSQFYVCAKKNNSNEISNESNKVVMYKQCDFSASETTIISLISGAGYVIPSNVNHVYVSGDGYLSYIEIADRNTDLVITLDNIKMTSAEGKHCIATQDGDYNSSNKHYSVTINVVGNNVLNGGSFTTTPGKPKENSETKGENGGNGGSAIVLPLVVFAGDGTLTLNGGNGGKGGDGSDSSGFSTSRFGAGGNGGNGGSGICCTTAVMAMNFAGIVRAYGGDAGDRGKPGVNGSVLSGPLYSGSYGDYYGEYGEEGLSLVGAIKQLRGTYMGE